MSWRWFSAGLLLLALVLLPSLLSSYYVALLSLVLIWAVFAMSLDLLVGYAGLPSLGHSAFFGLGAYGVAISSTRLLESFWLEMVVGLALTVAVAAIAGPLTLRARGIYFLMITLALTQIAWGIAFGWRSLTGGNDGLRGIPYPQLAPGWAIDDPWTFYYLVLAVATGAAAVMYLFTRSPFGRALVGVRENEARMDAMGYNVWTYKFVAFLVAAFFAGLAGGLYAYQNRFVSTTVLGVVPAAEAFLMVILGGSGTLFGPAIGAAIIVLFQNLVSSFTDRWTLVLGAVYVLVVIFAPKGVLVPAQRWLKRGVWVRVAGTAARRAGSVQEFRRSPGRPAREPDH